MKLAGSTLRLGALPCQLTTTAATTRSSAAAGPSRLPLPPTPSAPQPRRLSTTPRSNVPRRETSALYNKYYDKILKSDGRPSAAAAAATATAAAGDRRAEVANTMSKNDRKMLQRLLDREGGEAGIATVDGSYEEGLGKETKKNMFRLI